jgi:hypothetical protein
VAGANFDPDVVFRNAQRLEDFSSPSAIGQEVLSEFLPRHRAAEFSRFPEAARPGIRLTPGFAPLIRLTNVA